MKTGKLWSFILICAIAIGAHLFEKDNSDMLLAQESENIQDMLDSLEYYSLFDGQDLGEWAITEFDSPGSVMVDNGTIILENGIGATGITWTGDLPRINYEFTLNAMRVEGNDFFCGVTFPVEDAYCTFVVGGWGGGVYGLSSIDGLDAANNFTGQYMDFEENRWYEIRVRVTEESIEAWIDGRRRVSVDTQWYSFGIRPEVARSRPFGICSWFTTAALKNIRMKN